MTDTPTSIAGADATSSIVVKHEFDKPLILTTPHIKGQKVRDAQWLLAGHNKIKLPVIDSSHNQLATLTGRLDGEYGPVTAGATKEAKFELGYPIDKIDTVFGQRLYNYLTGQVVLPPDYLDRRKARFTKTVKAKALNLAITQIGTREQPYGSNKQKYGDWYGMNGVPWCAIFVSYCISHVWTPEPDVDWKYSYVPTIVHDAQIGKGHMSITFHPEPGDLVSYNFTSPNCHIEFFEKWVANGKFTAVGGNTGPTDLSNGGEVARGTRYFSNVSHFIRLSLA